jgi:hypothetical protein
LRAVALSLLLAGCAHADIGVNAGAPPPALPQASVQVSASGAPALALVAAALLISAFQPTDDSTPDAPMSPDRTVNEQDCTQPISSIGNVKCR